MRLAPLITGYHVHDRLSYQSHSLEKRDKDGVTSPGVRKAQPFGNSDSNQTLLSSLSPSPSPPSPPSRVCPSSLSLMCPSVTLSPLSSYLLLCLMPKSPPLSVLCSSPPLPSSQKPFHLPDPLSHSCPHHQLTHVCFLLAL